MVIMSTCVMTSSTSNTSEGDSSKPKRPTKFITKLSEVDTLTMINDLNTPVITLALDGLNSGIPTRTTPTVTPTMLRNINNEEFMLAIHPDLESHENEAGFVPPLIPQTNGNNSVYMNVDSKILQGGSTTVTSNIPTPAQNAISGTILVHQQPVSPIKYPSPSRSVTPPQPVPKRNVGGRRPNKEKGISPEEEQRRKIRRERNKEAAARCRKRRETTTIALTEETEQLEEKKQRLQNEIQTLQLLREELELSFEAHKPCCRISPYNVEDRSFLPSPTGCSDKVTLGGVTISIKSEPLEVPTSSCQSEINSNKRVALGSTSTRPRPTSLNVPSSTFPHQSKDKIVTTSSSTLISDVAGVAITTPSNGIPSFNFDSLMDGGTGLTPVSAPLAPSCSFQQQRSSNNNSTSCDLSSPDSVNSSMLQSL